MFEGLTVMPMLPASDLDRARGWYEAKLGLQPRMDMAEQELLVYDGFIVYRSQFAGTAKNTAAIWVTDDADRLVAQLRERGVRFEEYDMPELSWEDGVATDPSGLKTVWFKDSEENILSLAQLPAGMMPGG